MLEINFNLGPIIKRVKKEDTPQVDLSNALITVEDSKLVLTPEAVEALGLSAGDRLNISYYTVDETLTFPVIDLNGDSEAGNKLTKSNTVSFRGKQRETLLWYGNVFHLEKFNNYYKLVSEEIVENNDLHEEELDLLNLK